MGGRRWWILVAVIVAVLPFAVDLPLLVVAIPTLSRTLATSPAHVAQAAATVPLGLALLLPAGAAVGRRWSARGLLAGGLLVCLAGQSVELTADRVATLAIGRGVLSVGAALVLPAALRVVTAAFEPAEHPRVLAVWAGFTGLAVVAAPVLGGSLVEAFGRRGVFGPQLPAFAVALAATWLLAPAATDARPATMEATAEVAAPVVLFALLGAATSLSMRAQVDHHGSPLAAGMVVTVLLAAFGVGAGGTYHLLERWSSPAVLATGLCLCAAATGGLAATDRPGGLLLVVTLGAGAALVLGSAVGAHPLLRLAGGGCGVAVLGSVPPRTGLIVAAAVAAASAAGVGATLLGRRRGRRGTLPPA